MTFFQGFNFLVFHIDKASFHLLFDVCLKFANLSLKTLIVFKSKSLLLQGETAAMLVLKLDFDRLLDGLLVLFEPSVVLVLELILEIGDFTAQSKIKLFTHACFFGSKCGTFHLGQFDFHL